MGKFNHKSQKQAPKAKRPHTWWMVPMRRSTYSYAYPICTFCGLVKLRNEATEKAVKAGCWGAEQEDNP
jgi:hypothetical protein